MTVEPIDPSLTAFFVQELYIQKCIQIALLTLIVYNALTTLDKEVYYFWKGPASIVRCIFFLNRFTGILAIICMILAESLNVSETTCQFAMWTEALCNAITILLIDYILLLRVCALYFRKKKLEILLRLAFAMEAFAFLGITVYVSIFENYTLGELAVGKTICGENSNFPTFVGPLLWAIPLVYGAPLMAVALHGAARLRKETEGFKGFQLVNVVLQDQILYFFAVVFCSLTNVISYATEVNAIFSYVLVTIGSPALLCVLGSHLLIHLREAAEKGLNEGTSYRLDSISVINFGQALDERASSAAEIEPTTSGFA